MLNFGGVPKKHNFLPLKKHTFFFWGERNVLDFTLDVSKQIIGLWLLTLLGSSLKLSQVLAEAGRMKPRHFLRWFSGKNWEKTPKKWRSPTFFWRGNSGSWIRICAVAKLQFADLWADSAEQGRSGRVETGEVWRFQVSVLKDQASCLRFVKIY